MEVARLIGCAGTVGAHRVGAMEHGNFGEEERAMAARDEFQQEVLRLLRGGYSVDYIAARLSSTHGKVFGIKKRFGLVSGRDSYRASKLKCIHKPEGALEYVDDVRILRGPDTEAGEATYIASVNEDTIIGLTCGTVAGAINSVMCKVKEPRLSP